MVFIFIPKEIWSTLIEVDIFIGLVQLTGNSLRVKDIIDSVDSGHSFSNPFDYFPVQLAPETVSNVHEVTINDRYRPKH